MAFDSNIKGYMTFGKSFSRGGAFPLEAYEIWTDYDALVAYAANTNPDKDPSYIGQKVAYVDKENNKVTHYGIEIDGSLKELGATPIGDEKSIVVDETNYTISLKGVDGLVFERDIIGEDGQPTGQKENVQFQPLMTKDGLIWVEPSKTTVEGLAALIDGLTARVSALENDRVTEAELADAIKDFATDSEVAAAVKVETDRATAAEEALGKRIDTKLEANGWTTSITKGADGHVEGAALEFAHDDSKISLEIGTGLSVQHHAGTLTFGPSGIVGTVDTAYTGEFEVSAYKIKVDDKEFNYPTQSGTLIVDEDLTPYAKTDDVNTALDNKADADDLTALEEKVDAFLTGDGTEAALDSLKELIDYIETHDDADIAGVLESIQALENKVVLGTYTEGEETKEYATVKAYVEAAIAALKIGDYAKAADLTELAGRVSTLEAKPFDTYATKDEVNAKADASALENYYTKTNIDETLDFYVTTSNFNDTIDQLNDSISGTYATKAELSEHAETAAETYATKKELSDHADAAALAYATKDELNTHKQTAENTYAKQGDSYLKTETYAKTETYNKTEIDKFLDDVTGGSTESAASVKRALDAYIQNIDTEVYGSDVVNSWKDAEGNYTPKYASDNSRIDINKAAIDENAADIAALELAINGKPASGDTPEVLGLAGRLAAIEAEVGEVAESRIDALEGVTAQHTTDIAANTAAITTINTTTIPALEAAIAAEAKAREDADKAINEKIGTVESGKTVVDMINAVAGTIDFTPYATKKEVSENYATIAALEAIYKVTGEGESAVATGALATEIARATAAEKSLDDAIKLLTDGAGTSEIDSVKELIDYVNSHGATVEGINDRLDGHDTLLAGIGGTDQPATVVAAIEAAKNAAIAAIPALAIATDIVLGGVKSAADVVNGETTSVATNKVYVDATSAVGEVKAISTDILVNGSEDLILFGGNAGVNA